MPELERAVVESKFLDINGPAKLGNWGRVGDRRFFYTPYKLPTTLRSGF